MIFRRPGKREEEERKFMPNIDSLCYDSFIAVSPNGSARKAFRALSLCPFTCPVHLNSFCFSIDYFVHDIGLTKGLAVIGSDHQVGWVAGCTYTYITVMPLFLIITLHLVHNGCTKRNERAMLSLKSIHLLQQPTHFPFFSFFSLFL